MTATTIRKFRWFWAWEDEKEENWLEEMSKLGYHLKTVRFPGLYTFLAGEKVDYVYRLDYAPYTRKNSEYFTLFTDAGWRHLGEMNSWQYFRKEASQAAVNEIYTDTDSKIEKYKRFLGLLAGVLPLTLINVANLANISYHPVAVAGSILNFLFLGFLCFCFFQLFRRIRELKKL